MKKVYFAIESKDEGSATGETMWATEVGTDRFILENSPFECFGISFCDEFEARTVEGRLTFISVVKRGRHSTYRIRLISEEKRDEFLEFWKTLEKLGCSFEEASKTSGQFAIDLPPDIDVFSVYKRLEYGEDTKLFEFEEAHYYAK